MSEWGFVAGLGFRFKFWGLGFRVYGLEFRFKVWGLGFGVQRCLGWALWATLKNVFVRISTSQLLNSGVWGFVGSPWALHLLGSLGTIDLSSLGSGYFSIAAESIQIRFLRVPEYSFLSPQPSTLKP